MKSIAHDPIQPWSVAAVVVLWFGLVFALGVNEAFVAAPGMDRRD